MQIIINYLDLKRGEIYLEIERDIKNRNIELSFTDSNILERMVTVTRNKAVAVRDTQEYLLRRSTEDVRFVSFCGLLLNMRSNYK